MQLGPDGCPDLFSDGAMPTYELTISPKDWSELKAQFDAKSEDKIWHPASFRLGNEVVPEVRVRLRGDNSLCADKMQLAISFNQTDPDARFHGLRRIDLDHGGCRLFAERLAASYMRDLGLPAACVNHAKLIVNGQYYGLFVNLEHVNKDFLERTFGGGALNDGNLYKYGYVLKTNESTADESDRQALERAPDADTVSQWVDLDEAITEWAAEAVLPARDNYWSNHWNYYLYHHPTRGFLYVPNDLDQVFPLPDGTENENTILPYTLQRPADRVLADPLWMARYLEAVKRAIDAYDVAKFEDRVYRWWAQIQDAARTDPHHPYDESHVTWFLDRVRARAPILSVWRNHPPGRATAPPPPPGPETPPDSVKDGGLSTPDAGHPSLDAGTPLPLDAGTSLPLDAGTSPPLTDAGETAGDPIDAGSLD